jgi:hypothetical protein
MNCYLRKTSFAYTLYHLVFVLEIQLDGVFDDFFLLFGPKVRIVEVENAALGAI